MKKLLRPGFVLLAWVFTLTATAQVPLLNSYPSAAATVFLDFDGQTVNNSSWNTNGPIFCGASGLSNADIITVFNRVAEDYRPFNINITTDSTKYFAAPAEQRTRVILTVTSSWYGSAGGVSFVGSFTWGDDTPCFVFTALLSYNVKNIAEAAAHEAGHTLGLYHQATYDANCNKVTDYNIGQGTGEIGWAPIMGAGYYQNLTLWNNGPNSYGCTNLQSDLDIITSYNGFTYRTDDYAATFAGATNLPFTSNQFSVNGVIERSSDQDLFKFTQPSYGEFKLNATPYNVGTGDAGSDLDMQVSIYNSSQTLLNVYNPGTLLNSVVDTFLNAGVYYIKVEGKGNVYAPNYASLGSYSLLGNFTNGSILPVHRLDLYGQINGDQRQLTWIIDASEQVTKQVVEISTDGINFSELTGPPAAARAYSYTPNTNDAVQYRLQVTFDNGQQYYSNIVTLRQSGITSRPQLTGNLVYSGNVVVSSPGVYNYAIYDFNGKMITKGMLTNGINNITTDQIPAGMYLIRFTNGTGQWTDKFMRQ